MCAPASVSSPRPLSRGVPRVSPSRRRPSAHTPTPRYRAATATTASATGTSGSLSDQATPAAPGAASRAPESSRPGCRRRPSRSRATTVRRRPCERSRSSRPRRTGVAASRRAARRSPASTAPPSRVERMLWARRAVSPRRRSAADGPSVRGPAPASPRRWSAPGRLPTRRRPPGRRATPRRPPPRAPGRRASATTSDVGPVVPDAHRPPPSTPATTVAPATSSVAETSHHSRRVVARSRGPATTWSTHGSGGTTGPRRRPSPWTSTVSATARRTDTTAAPGPSSRSCSHPGSLVMNRARATVKP